MIPCVRLPADRHVLRRKVIIPAAPANAPPQIAVTLLEFDETPVHPRAAAAHPCGFVMRQIIRLQQNQLFGGGVCAESNGVKLHADRLLAGRVIVQIRAGQQEIAALGKFPARRFAGRRAGGERVFKDDHPCAAGRRRRGCMRRRGCG